MTTTDNDTIVLDAMGHIYRILSESYPYTSGSVILNVAGFDRKVLLRILEHCIKDDCSVVVYPEKNQIKIVGFKGGY